MDLIGPLSHSQGRNYETHHPEVISFRIIDARTIAGELIRICFHLREILTDQGSNFTFLLISKFKFTKC